MLTLVRLLKVSKVSSSLRDKEKERDRERQGDRERSIETEKE